MYTFKWAPKELDVLEVDSENKPVLNEDGSYKYKKSPALFSGEVLLMIPKNSERMSLLKDLSLAIDTKGEISKAEAMDRGEQMVSFALKHIKEVNLVRIEDGYKFDKTEMLEYDADGSAILNQIASTLANGVRLGKS